MNAGGIEKEVEQHSAAASEWSVRETDEVEEAPELLTSGMDATTEAFEPGAGVAGVMSTIGSEDQESSSSWHNPLNTPEPGDT